MCWRCSVGQAIAPPCVVFSAYGILVEISLNTVMPNNVAGWAALCIPTDTPLWCHKPKNSAVQIYLHMYRIDLHPSMGYVHVFAVILKWSREINANKWVMARNPGVGVVYLHYSTLRNDQNKREKDTTICFDLYCPSRFYIKLAVHALFVYGFIGSSHPTDNLVWWCKSTLLHHWQYNVVSWDMEIRSTYCICFRYSRYYGVQWCSICRDGTEKNGRYVKRVQNGIFKILLLNHM